MWLPVPDAMPVFIPLFGLHMATVIPAKGDLCVSPSPLRERVGVRVKGPVLQGASLPAFARMTS